MQEQDEGVKSEAVHEHEDILCYTIAPERTMKATLTVIAATAS